MDPVQGYDEVFVHPEFDYYSLNNDFALVKLINRSDVTPVDMDETYPSTFDENDNLWTIGFGNRNGGYYSDFPDILHHVEVSYVTNNKCQDAYSFGTITDNMMCAADAGEDSCQGGKPMFKFCVIICNKL